MSLYKYSVIMPTWNRAQFLPRAIRSVLDQDCVPAGEIELIVVDDGSTDETPTLVPQLAKSEKRHMIRYVRVEHSGEPGTTRNVGLNMADGDYIAYLDSDDYWLPHHSSTANAWFKRDPELAMVSNAWALASFEVAGGKILTRLQPRPHPIEVVNTNCRVHKRTCLEKVGLFNDTRWGEDSDFFGRIEKQFPCAKTGIVTTVNGYIRDGNNLTYEFDAGVRGKYK